MSYQAPLKDMLFVMTELAGLADLSAWPGCEEATRDTAEAVLEEHAKFCASVVAPLNQRGDRQPSSWHDGRVTMSPGFKEAYRAFAEAGWQGVQHPTAFGGQGLPKLLAAPCMEMLNSASLAFALVTLLTDGAVEALLMAGSAEQQALYLPKLVSGQWTGTMNLTEPQAGSDLAAVRSRAVPQGDGSYRIAGTKIFISYGDHDMADNIVHLVLARTPDAPPGVRGISLFIVPKFLVGADGALGARNDVQCVSLEHKMGIKASPTAVLQFGDAGGAVGYLVGRENRGLEYMFIMMNAARFGVGLEGIGLAERAYQQAAAFAKQRVQSRDLADSAGPVTIIHHPDVRRMLMSMRAQTEAARALAYVGAARFDRSRHDPDPEARARALAEYAYLVPVIKGWSTEMVQDVTRDNIQVHGGMGYIEETGAAQHYRDAKILSIYEGTTAIQANDLVGRKTLRDGGAVAWRLLAQVRAAEAQLAECGGENGVHFAALRTRLAAGRADLEAVVGHVVEHGAADPRGVYAGSVPYLMLAGIVFGGWQMARAALAAQRRLDAGEAEVDFLEAKIATARFFGDAILTRAPGLRSAIVDGSAGVLALRDDQF